MVGEFQKELVAEEYDQNTLYTYVKFSKNK